MKERSEGKPRPINVYFRALQREQHREDDKAVVSMGNIEYILFLHEQEKKEVI